MNVDEMEAKKGFADSTIKRAEHVSKVYTEFIKEQGEVCNFFCFKNQISLLEI